MCLIIPSNPALTPPTDYVRVFKAYTYKIEFNKLHLKSLFRNSGFDLSHNITLVSDRPKTELTEDEQEFLEVEQGLHGFTSLTKLKQYVNEGIFSASSPFIIVEFSGDPEEFVARNNEGEICFRKLTFVQITSTKILPELSFTTKRNKELSSKILSTHEILV